LRAVAVVAALSMAVLCGSEGAAAAAGWLPGPASGGARPTQASGNAAARGHAASVEATAATAKGGHAGALTAPGELGADTGGAAHAFTPTAATPKAPTPR
jgi:hypothetical protein